MTRFGQHEFVSNGKYLNEQLVLFYTASIILTSAVVFKIKFITFITEIF